MALWCGSGRGVRVDVELFGLVEIWSSFSSSGGFTLSPAVLWITRPRSCMATSPASPAPNPGEESQPAQTVDSADVAGAIKPRSGLGLLARRVHFLAGFAVAPFLIVMCLTGLANAFTPQIVNTFHGQELFVEAGTGAPGRLSGQVAAAVAAHPEGAVKAIIPPSGPNRTTRVVLDVPGLPNIDKFSEEDLTVYVDPYTNRVRGELTTVKDRPPAEVWLRHVHGNLHLGPTGRLYSEFATSWVPLIVLGGLILWVGQRRTRGLRGLLAPAHESTSKRARLRDWHGSLGLCLGLGLVALALTGFSQSNYVGDRVDQLLAALHASEPNLKSEKVTAPAGAEPLSVNQVLEIAKTEDLHGELTITVPSEASEVFEVEETGKGWPIQSDSIAIDSYTGQVTERIAFDDYPILAKLNILGVQAHDGTLLGAANQIFVALLALGTLILILIAYRIWWSRRPHNALWPPLPPPVWRTLPKNALFLLVVVAVLLAWVMPVLGSTLIGFLILDSLISKVKRRSQSKARV